MVLLIFYLGFAVSLFVLNYLLLVPPEYGASTAAVTVDRVRRNIEAFYTEGESKHQLEIINKTTGDMIKTTISAGTFISMLILVITYKGLGGLSLLAVLPAFVFAAYLTRKTLQKQFTKWQVQMCEGLSPLLIFLKSFFALEGITTKETLEYSLEHLPEPIKNELTETVTELSDTGDPRGAFDRLADKVKHRMFYAVCFRLGVGWESRINPNICDDLLRQINNDKELQIAKATALKSGAYALLCALGIMIALPVYAYPIAKFMGLNFVSGVLH